MVVILYCLPLQISPPLEERRVDSSTNASDTDKVSVQSVFTMKFNKWENHEAPNFTALFSESKPSP